MTDLTSLAADLTSPARPPRVLRPRTLAARMKVIAIPPGAVREIAYRPGDQELVAVIGMGLEQEADDAGALIRLVRRHSRTGPSALDVIAKALGSTPGPRFVAGDVRRGPYGLEIDPTALVTDRVVVPDLETEVATVESLPRGAARRESPMHAAIALGSTLLEEALHDGLSRLRGGFADRATHAAEVLGAVGLGGAQQRVLALHDAARARDPSAARTWLDAALRLELTREAMLEA